MPTLPLSTRLLMLPTLLLVFCRPVPLRADVPDPPERQVEGRAVTQSGKPLAHATLYLFGLPPGQTDGIELGDQSTVVTDDRGRFVWVVPAGLPPLEDYVRGESMSCYALAADRSTAQYRLALRPNQRGTDAEQGRRSLLEDATRPCETKWLLGGAHPIFSVVVPETSDVLLTVRGPDGRPLREREVSVVPTGLMRFYGGAVVYTGRTDAGGRLRMRFFPGPLHLQLFVPGVGYGSTGTLNLEPGRSVMPLVPPLAPFAQISGTVAAALAAPGAFVRLDDFSRANDWYDPSAAVDAGGRWTLAGLLPGQHCLVLKGGRGEGEPVWMTVQPGQKADGVVLGPKLPPSRLAALATALLSSGSADTAKPPSGTPSVRGRVTDSEGRPVAGADVYAVSWQSGGRRDGQKVLTAKTDAEGGYDIPDLPIRTGAWPPFIRLVAHHPGFPLAFGDGTIERGLVSGRWQDVTVNLVLPAQHPALTVRVLQDGKPLPNVPVELAAQGENSLIPTFYRESDRGEAAQTLRELLAPSAQTGPDGAARFADLTPGLWDVKADWTPGVWDFTAGPIAPFNVSTGVIVRAGEDLSYTVSVHPPPGATLFRVLAPNGLPPADPQVLVGWATAHEEGSFNFSTLDKSGNGRENFHTPSLWLLRARFQGTPNTSNVLTEPFYEGTALVANSPATPASEPVVIPTQRRGPAGIRVRLEDARGRPLRGTVFIGDAFEAARYSASADALGQVVFPDMPSGKYTLTAQFTDLPTRPALDHEGSPLPSDTALMAGTSQPLPQTVTVRADEDMPVTFRPLPLGYLRLRLAAVAPATAEDYYVDARLDSGGAFLDTRIDPRTGEFLVGPLPAGRRTLRLFRQVLQPVPEDVAAGETTVTVEAGRVVRAVLVPHEPPGPPVLLNSLPLPSGTVLLPDGKTPAWGARAAVFFPQMLYPVRLARADAQGRLTINDSRRSSGWWPVPPLDGLTEPVLAAWLPGANGAVIVPYAPGQEARLVLPAAVSPRGRVTVGGRSVEGLPSSFRIQAAYQGRGTLNEVLSVEATAQADGTFELAGLTPGTYRVQAARDNIWVSGTQTLTVGADAPPNLTLDIAPPGAPIVLHLEDEGGKPLPGREVRIERPAGPLTEEIWPTALTADGLGNLHIEGLEAGAHRLTEESAAFDVPLWTADAPLITRRIVLRHTP